MPASNWNLQPEEGWWEKAFERTRNHSEIHGHPKGKNHMIIIVAYDITDPKRLRKVADCCKNYGFRVQYSVFECHVKATQFEALWKSLQHLINPKEDRIIAYPLTVDSCKKIRSSGTVVLMDKPVCYLF